MSEDFLKPHRIEPIIPEFDPALDALYALQVATAKQMGWPVPAREDFERQYREEMAAKRQQ